MMRKIGAVITLAAAACSSSSKLDIPDDHTLHDLSSDDADATHVRYGGKQVSLADLPVVGDRIGLPVRGIGDVLIDLTVPKVKGAPDYTKAHGTITIACTKCQIGDDVAKLRMTPKSEQARDFLGDGIPFGHLSIDRFEATLAIGDGTLELTSWKVASPDLQLEVSLSLELATSFDASRVKGCVRFKGTDALQKRDPKTAAVLSVTGAARGADGLEHISLGGTVGDVKRIAKECRTH